MAVPPDGGRYDSVEEATNKVEDFLKPLLNGSSRINQHANSFLAEDENVQLQNNQNSLASQIVQVKQEQGVAPAAIDGKWVIAHACHLLTGLHEAVCMEQGDKPQGQASYSTALFAGVYGLLDLIILEGVYPSLSAGVVSIPGRRAKSILFTKTSLHVPFPKDLGVLESVLYGTLDHLAIASHRGIQPLIRGRVLNDLIAAHADLSFSPSRSESKRHEALTKLQGTLDQLPLSTVYQVLSGLMRPQAPDWFRAGLSELLALLPTKPLGVRNAIEFIAASNNESSSASNTDNHLPSQGPPLPFDALKQASKLLSAVPRSMPIEVYLNMVGPQLMSLLDGDAGPELSQVAAYVIASGFLGKRALGAPGSPGWQYLVEPMQQAINPSTSRSSSRQENGRVQQTRVITSDRDLAQILNRMSALIRAYSNSALTGRLLRPLIQSLWGIASFDASSIVDPVSSSLAKDLLQTFLTLAGGNRELALLAEDLLWDGPQTWTFATGSEGGIAIVTRESVSASSGDLMTILPKIDRRINLLCELISTSSVDDGLLGDLFFKQIKIWFQYRYQIDEHLVETSVARNPQQSMATAKLVLGLLDRFGSRIASRPENAINLISDIIKQRLDSAQYTVPRKKSLLLMNTEETQQNHLSSTMDDDETFDIAISLLSTLAEAPSFKASEESKESLRSIEDSLLSLRSQQIQEATRQTISRALQALSKVHSSSLAGSRPVSDGSQTESRQHAFKQIQQDLSSALPPVRTSAIHSLKSLMRETSFALDVPASAVLLIHLARSDPEDYVYLAAIRALVLLAEARDARLVTRLLVDAFQDAKEEAGVDGRLRLGEAIIGIVGSISSMPATAVHRQVIEIVSDVAIEVASRRGNRRREQDEKKRKARLDRMKKKEAERAWGGEVPENPTLNLNLNDDDEEYANESPEQRTRRLKELEAMEQIVKGWEDTGPEEDIRVRASALSIVSEVLEHATDLLNQRQVVDAVDMALAILVIESNASQAILRRAAVLTLYALLKSMDRAFEENRQLVVGLEASRWLDIEKVLSLLGDVDPDELVRGHATAVLEGLEAFRMKQILGVRNDGMQDALTPRFTLEGRLQGLDVDVDAVRPVGGKSKIQEIE